MISKNASNKNSLKLNFLQKTPKTHISISPRSGAKGRQTFAIVYVMHSGKRLPMSENVISQ